ARARRAGTFHVTWPDAALLLTQFSEAIAIGVIGTGLAQCLFHLWQLAIAGVALQRYRGIPAASLVWRRYAEAAPPISLLVPAYNEELSIAESVRSLLSLHYPTFEVVVVNDGSTDGTLQTLVRTFELKPLRRSYEAVAQSAAIRGVYSAAAQPRLVVV